LGDLVGGRAVDRVDTDERGVALRAARTAHGPGHPIAGDQLAAADLRGGDVDVVVGALALAKAQEARAVAQQLDDPLDDALASISSALRRRRKPSMASSEAIACRSASGLASRASRESTDIWGSS